MKYTVYVVKCQSNKHWVGFTTRELNEYLKIMIDGQGPMFTRRYCPSEILSISESDDIEEVKVENVKVYEMLAKVLGPDNVQMDAKRYYEITNKKLTEVNENPVIHAVPQPNVESNLVQNVDYKYVVYSLICTKNARYIGFTKNLKETINLHEEGKMGNFTRAYKPKKVETKEYYNKEINAKIAQIEILDRLKAKYGSYTKVYTEFLDSKPNLSIVWEDVIPPVDEKLFENTPNGPDIKYWVYVLGCEESKYYVGYTSNLRRRFKQHLSINYGANFTHEFLPYFVYHIEGHTNKNSAQKAEMNWTLDLKKLAGKYEVFGFWLESKDPQYLMYFAHEKLEKWVIKNPKAYEIINKH